MTMKLAIALVAVSLAFVASADRPTSQQDLTNRALKALRKGDAKAFHELMLRHADVEAHCPEMAREIPATWFEKARKKAARKVAQCAEAFDWAILLGGTLMLVGNIIALQPLRKQGRAR